MATLKRWVPRRCHGRVLCRLKEQSLVKELRPRDVLESSSDSDEKAPTAKPPSLSKRKLELEVETVEKKKKGRPRKDSRLLPMSLSVQVSLAVGASRAWTAPPSRSGTHLPCGPQDGEARVAGPASLRGLPSPVTALGCRAQGRLWSCSPPPP